MASHFANVTPALTQRSWAMRIARTGFTALTNSEMVPSGTVNTTRKLFISHTSQAGVNESRMYRSEVPSSHWTKYHSDSARPLPGTVEVTSPNWRPSVTRWPTPKMYSTILTPFKRVSEILDYHRNTFVDEPFQGVDLVVLIVPIRMGTPLRQHEHLPRSLRFHSV